MDKKTLLLFAAAFFLEAVFLSSISTTTAPTGHANTPAAETLQGPTIRPGPAMAAPEPPLYVPADQTAVYHPQKDQTNGYLLGLSVLYAALSGFILGYVNYF